MCCNGVEYTLSRVTCSTMIKSFIKDGAIYMIPSLLARGVSLFLIPLYTRVLTPADYGAFDLFTVFAAITNMVVALEVNQAIARFYPTAKDELHKRKYASTALWFTVAAYGVFSLILLMASSTLGPMIMGRDDLDGVFRIGTLHIFLGGVNYLIQNQFKWELRSKHFAVQSIILLLITSGVSIYLTYFLKMGVMGVILGQIAGFLGSTTFGLYMLRKTYLLSFKKSLLKEMLVYSAPLVPSGIAVFLTNYLDRIMINGYLSIEEVGLYGIAFRLAGLTSLLLIGIRSALMPLIFNNYEKEQTKRDIEILFRYFSVGALLFFAALSLFSKEILQVFTTEAYYESYRYVPILILGILFSQSYIFMPGASIAKKTKYFLYINLGAAALNIGLNLLLIPSLGLYGVAIATMSSHFMTFVLHYLVSQRFYRVPHNMYRLGFLMISTAIGVSIFIYSSWSFGILLKLALIVGVGVLAALLRTFKPEELARVKSKLRL